MIIEASPGSCLVTLLSSRLAGGNVQHLQLVYLKRFTTNQKRCSSLSSRIRSGRIGRNAQADRSLVRTFAFPARRESQRNRIALGVFHCRSRLRALTRLMLLPE